MRWQETVPRLYRSSIVATKRTYEGRHIRRHGAPFEVFTVVFLDAA
tara:strand:- start:102 stop:239 length:138 start_codon:yes stop_codon:yes gene_type:complete